MSFDSVNFADLAKESEGAFEPLPIGTYECDVNSAEAGQSSTGKMMFKLTYKVVEGPHAGRIIYNNITVSPENPNAMRMFFKNMMAHGIGKDVWAGNPAPGTICGMLEGRPVTVGVTHREWQGEMRENVSKLVRSNRVASTVANPGGGAIPNVPAPAPAPTVAPAVPAVPVPAPAPAPAPAPSVPVAVPEPVAAPQTETTAPTPAPASEPTPAPAPSATEVPDRPPLPF